MRNVGIFHTKTHLNELIKEVQQGEELCITNRGKEVAFIVPVEKYYREKNEFSISSFIKLKKRAPLGNYIDILEMKSWGRK